MLIITKETTLIKAKLITKTNTARLVILDDSAHIKLDCATFDGPIKLSREVGLEVLAQWEEMPYKDVRRVHSDKVVETRTL